MRFTRRLVIAVVVCIVSLAVVMAVGRTSSSDVRVVRAQTGAEHSHATARVEAAGGIAPVVARMSSRYGERHPTGATAVLTSRARVMDAWGSPGESSEPVYFVQVRGDFISRVPTPRSRFGSDLSSLPADVRAQVEDMPPVKVEHRPLLVFTLSRDMTKVYDVGVISPGSGSEDIDPASLGSDVFTVSVP